MKKPSNLNILGKVVFYLNKWNKQVGTPSSFGRKRPFMSLNSCAFIENLSSSERVRAHARANLAKNDALKGCTMQLNGIVLSFGYLWLIKDGTSSNQKSDFTNGTHLSLSSHRGKRRYVALACHALLR